MFACIVHNKSQLKKDFDKRCFQNTPKLSEVKTFCESFPKLSEQLRPFPKLSD